MYCRELTKKMLKEMGVVDVYWDEEKNDWIIHRYWYKNSSKTIMVHTYFDSTLAKSGKKKYKIVNWSYKGKNFCTTTSRIVKAWIKGRLREGNVIDHRNNDSLNDDLSNLREMTIKGNNRKRFKDHPDCTCFNQYRNTEKK